MEQQIFTNEVIISWLQYYSKNTTLDLEHVKMIDITGKNKNLIPTVEAHKTTLVFTNAGIDDVFYRLWNAGLGDCEVWYNIGSDPSGPILHQPVKEMIDRGIHASAAMLLINPNARNTARIGLNNGVFQRGTIHYVGSEIRAVILNKMQIAPQDDICVIGGESIVIEAALSAPEGSIIAVEYSGKDRATLEDNVSHFDLQNVTIIDHVDDTTMQGLAIPTTVFLVASASTNQEIACLTKLNPDINIVIYTLDFKTAAGLPDVLNSFGITNVDTIQISVAKLTSSGSYKQDPAPWIITGRKS